MKDAIKKKLAKFHNHVEENKTEYFILGSTLSVVFLTYVCIKQAGVIEKQGKILASPIKLSMFQDDFRKMHEDGGWMVWDANPGNNTPEIVLGVTEIIEKRRKDKAA